MERTDKKIVQHQKRQLVAVRWRRTPSMTDQEHVALFDSIRNGKPVNCVNYMFGSTLLALLGQFVCNTGHRNRLGAGLLTSKQSVELERYGFDVAPPIKPNRERRLRHPRSRFL